ncbi:coil containing protein [Vibrio phage 1.152.O._10N.222.46.E1]|uniref:Coil containing protein n=5 Tax=Nahantvirus 49C7 TaxID=2846601 RepID=A0A2I7RBC5_9CAUD|nr:hypothetical protein HYP57_gp053 [Vibrio phage 1.026.O._10N.222.49.C7]AUR82536.1 hypothetical protein NVP1025O_053 [Vibrio phage 1.025.O._10N.222.46.B6]AUR90786.1 hypothetical protein NVP1150O_053 [Vibrio phage 1.150.O._10N.222.46.A6]AUR90959.1 coil containing protein [Vibrio phage 1.152.O._10N.222.46.E1]AUS02427.1 hypothetical protein NVP2130O_053 [Vibrio phage 2.130.O._10N.222.46.C2]AUR82644.1 hypothetical protein NVP1026O_053 [Vibrio phage 1.026.O._10N.222.49.C7]
MREHRHVPSDTLTPMSKYHIKQTLMEVLATSTTFGSVNIDGLIHWYISDVLTASSTKQTLYHLLPKPLHQFVVDYVVNPQEDEPEEAMELKLKHAEAMESINVRLTEKLLEQ